MLNKAQLIGRLGKDPEVRDASGVKVASFTLATTDRGFKTQDGKEVPERTEWHNIVVWRGLADVAEKYLHKGDKVYIEGKIRTRSYEDNNKITRYVTEIFADNMEMLTVKKDGQSAPTAAPTPPAPAPQQDDDGQLPF